ncbi:T9SS type A sorting domain-containing protein [Puia sp. P3]|uniref:T9SS type A sorting domain-containing protein n=1 Tax=Puia sp. P3 TaxID=3423952 RepID=UPI003D668256
MQNGAQLTIENGAGLFISGGLMLEKGSRLANNGRIDLSKSKTGGAFWHDSTISPYSYGSGIAVFNGGGDQSLQSINGFHRIEVNADSIHLGSDIASDQWYLIKGRIATGQFKAVVLSASDTSVQAAAGNPHFDSSWFDGTLRRAFDGQSANTFWFPVGNSQKANAAVMDNLQAAPLGNISYLEASFRPRPGTDAGLILEENGTPFTMINDAGVWYLTPDQQPTQGRYDLLLYLNGFSGLQDNSFAILRRPDSSTAAGDWEVPDNSLLPPNTSSGRMTADGYARRNSIGGFSQYGIGMTATPLPVTLIEFVAFRLGPSKVVLKWETGMESGNKGFDIEKRPDNDSSFTFAGFVPSAAQDGNSNAPLHYTYTDANNYKGITYYRLKQTDLDNRYNYTAIRAVSGSGQSGVSILLYPNPSQGQFSIRMDGSTETYEVRIVDGKGAVIKNRQLHGNTPLQVTGMPPGAYVVQILNAFGRGAAFAQKIVVVK